MISNGCICSFKMSYSENVTYSKGKSAQILEKSFPIIYDFDIQFNSINEDELDEKFDVFN